MVHKKKFTLYDEIKLCPYPSGILQNAVTRLSHPQTPRKVHFSNANDCQNQIMV